MTRPEEQTNLILVILSLLVLMVVVFAHLNAGNLDLKRELEMKSEFLLTHENQEYRVTMDDVLKLQLVDFETTMKTSTTDATLVNFKGVELKQLLTKYQIQLREDSIIQVAALDGYGSALTGAEVLANNKIYLCTYMNGEILRSKQEGGFGPYMMVIKDSQFSQRWCKFVEKITVK